MTVTESAPMSVAAFLKQLDERKSAEQNIRLNPGVAFGALKTLQAERDALRALVRDALTASGYRWASCDTEPSWVSEARALLARIDGRTA